MDMEEQASGRWKIDKTINLQGLVTGFMGAAVAIVLAWFALAGDIRALKDKDTGHDASLVRLEAEMQRNRQETKEQMRDIGVDVREQMRDLSADVKQIRGILMDNTAGNRPDMRRWAK